MSVTTKTPIVVWLIEDHAAYRRTVARIINGERGLSCPQAFSCCEDALRALETEPPPHVVLLDIGLPGMSGLDGIALLADRAPGMSIVVLTVFEDDDKIFRAICAGAHGYLLKGQPVERITAGIRDVLEGGAPMSARISRQVLNRFSRRIPGAQNPVLTDHERQILEHAAEGLAKKEIAARLEMNYHTVDASLRRIYTKLHVHSRSGAVAKAIKDGLIPPR